MKDKTKIPIIFKIKIPGFAGLDFKIPGFKKLKSNISLKTQSDCLRKLKNAAGFLLCLFLGVNLSFISSAGVIGKGLDISKDQDFNGINGGNNNISPFSSNIYSNPYNGYYCDSVTTYTYENFLSDIKALERDYKNVSDMSLGKTLDGRDIILITLGEASCPDSFLAVAEMHGREYITSQLLMRQLKDLLERNKTENILSLTALYAIPMVNPDGAVLSQKGLSGIKSTSLKLSLKEIIKNDSVRENYSGDTDWYFRRWKNNSSGVDINRNFPVGFDDLDDGRHMPSYEYFKGYSSLSEPETRALVQALSLRNFKGILNYHSQGEVVYSGAACSGEEVNKNSLEMGEIVSALTGYRLSEESGGTGPGFKDFSSLLGIPSVTVEVGLGSSPLPETDITEICLKNRDVLYELLKKEY